MPAWVENGKYYNQSRSILRKLAQKYGYQAKDDFTNYKIDAVIDTCADHFPNFYKVLMSGNARHDEEGYEAFEKCYIGLVAAMEKAFSEF